MLLSRCTKDGDVAMPSSDFSVKSALAENVRYSYKPSLDRAIILTPSSDMVRYVTVKQPILELGMTLGEGVSHAWQVILRLTFRLCMGMCHCESNTHLQDVLKQRLYFVDIDNHHVYTYEPSSDTVGFEIFSEKITSLALVEGAEGVRLLRR